MDITTGSSKWYKLAKQIGALDPCEGRKIEVEELEGLSDKECAEEIAKHYASISQEYEKSILIIFQVFYLPFPLQK